MIRCTDGRAGRSVRRPRRPPPSRRSTRRRRSGRPPSCGSARRCPRRPTGSGCRGAAAAGCRRRRGRSLAVVARSSTEVSDAVGVDRDPDRPLSSTSPSVDTRVTARRADRRRRPRTEGGHPDPRVRRGVDATVGLAAAGQRGQRGLDELRRAARRSRRKLRSASRCTQAIELPGRMSWNCCSSTVFHSRQLVVRVGGAVRTAAVAAHSSASRSRCSLRRLPCLVGLGGVGGAVVLQVQLARPHRRVRVLGLGAREELARGARSRPSASPPGRAAGARPPSSRGWGRRRRRRSRTAPATGCRALLGELARGPGQLLARRRGVVGVDGREVREDPGAVDALPPEGVVRELVGLVPRHLLGEEPARARRARRSAGARRCSRTSRAARPPRSRRRTPPGRTACRARTGGPSPRRRACSCPTRPTCRRRARTGHRRPARGSGRTPRGGSPSSTRTAGPTSRRRRSPGPRPSGR